MIFGLVIIMATVIVILIFSRVAFLSGLLDRPNTTTKLHDSPTPVIGGIAVVCIVLTVLGVYDRPPKLDLLLLGIGSVALLGALDDGVGLSVWLRLAVQIGVAIGMAVVAGVSIENFGSIAGYTLTLNQNTQVLVTVAFAVFVMNSINMSDGIDGNAAGLVLIALGLIAFGQFLTVDEVRKPKWLTALFLSVAVFWMINVSLTPLKKIFLGDAGTLALGFILSWLCVDFSQGPGRSIHPVMVGWILLIPGSDCFAVVTIRVLTKRSPVIGDREHIHHVLLELSEQSGRKALFLIMSSAAILGGLGIFLTSLNPVYGLVSLIFVMAFLVSLHVRHGLKTWKRKHASV